MPLQNSTILKPNKLVKIFRSINLKKASVFDWVGFCNLFVSLLAWHLPLNWCKAWWLTILHQKNRKAIAEHTSHFTNVLMTLNRFFSESWSLSFAQTRQGIYWVCRHPVDNYWSHGHLETTSPDVPMVHLFSSYSNSSKKPKVVERTSLENV